MKLQHLRVFTAVVESGGVMAAAERLHASQPAVSAALRALEEELGEPLFQRPGGGRRLVPTARALHFHRHAVDILRRCEVARAEFRTVGNTPRRLRLGVLPTLASRDVAAVAATLHREAERWQFQLREGGTADLAGSLRRGKVEASWTVVETDTAHGRVIWREDFVVLVAPDHRLARYRNTGIVLRDLDGEHIVLRASCELQGGRLRDAGIVLQVGARAERDELALRLVAAGVGIAIAPRSLADGSTVVAVPVADLGIQRSIGVAWGPETPEHILTAVLDAITKQAEAAGLSPLV